MHGQLPRVLNGDRWPSNAKRFVSQSTVLLAPLMSRRYDSRTTTFSPEGRLYQVEYAMEAISHAGTVLGILAKDGVVLAAEKKVTSKLLEQDKSSEKVFQLSGCVCAFVSTNA